MATGALSGMFSHPGFYSVVAEQGGKLVGSNFVDERASILGVGPITVDPAAQDSSVGRLLMQTRLCEQMNEAPPGCDFSKTPSTIDHLLCIRSWAWRCGSLLP
jgi:hypothetical protein